MVNSCWMLIILSSKFQISNHNASITIHPSTLVVIASSLLRHCFVRLSMTLLSMTLLSMTLLSMILLRMALLGGLNFRFQISSFKFQISDLPYVRRVSSFKLARRRWVTSYLVIFYRMLSKHLIEISILVLL